MIRNRQAGFDRRPPHKNGGKSPLRRRWIRLYALVLAGVLTLSGCVGNGSFSVDPQPTDTREMRGVWVSFLDLDPLLKGADPATAQKRLDRVMDVCRQNGMNTVFFHVRSHSDARYASTVYPAAAAAADLLTAGFDPLAYAITAAHDRGLELHAWINPYRIGQTPDKDKTLCFEKEGTWYYAPHQAGARQKVLDGIREILDNYTVDGIHFDDYFYPEGMNPKGEPFENLPKGANVAQWRQTQVDTLISGVYGLCRAKGVPFGVSPMAAIDRCRDELYANVARWMKQPGYIDYICPQLYTGFFHENMPYERQLERWLALPRREGVELYVGLAMYKAGLKNDTFAGTGAGEWAANDNIIARQVAVARQKKADGFVLFRYDQLVNETAAAERKALAPLL